MDTFVQLNEDQFFKLAESAPDAIYFSANGYVRYANPAAQRLFGVTSLDQLLDKSVVEFVHPDYRTLVAERIRRLQNYGETAQPCEETYIRINGSLVDVEVTAVPFTFNGEEGGLVFVRDITARKQAELALAKESEKNHILLRNASDGIHILDAEGNVLEASDSFCDMLGYTRAEVIGMNVVQWDDHYSADELKDVIGRQISEPGRQQFETRHRRKDGSVFDVEVSGLRLTYDGRSVLFYAARDISERKVTEDGLRESERRHRVIVESAGAGFWMIDTSHRTTFVNSTLCNMLGYSQHEMLGRMPSEFADEENQKLFKEHMAHIGDTVHRQYEVQLRRKDGQGIPLSFHATTHFNAAGAVDLSFAFITDLTERKGAERALSESEGRFRRFFEQAPLPLGFANMQGEILAINARFVQVFGYTQAELTSIDDWWRFAFPEPLYRESIRKTWGSLVASAVEQGSDIEAIECRVTCKDGAELIMRMSGIAMDDGILATFFDITEHRRSEQRLASSESELKAIIDTEPECVKILAEDGTILRMNRAGLQMIDADSAEQIVGLKVLNLVSPQYRHAFMALTRRVFMGVSGMLEFEIVGFKGRRRWLETHAVPLRDPHGKITSLLGVTRDITARKEADEALSIAAIAFESQEGLMVTDANNRILNVNKAFTALTGYEAEEVVGKTPAVLRSDKHGPEFYRSMWESLGQTGTWQGEVWNRRKDGKNYPEWLVITAVKGVNGLVTHYVGAFTDLTQRKDAEKQILTLAFYDALTRLPNRRLLIDRLTQALAVSKRSDHYGALIYLDLDHFKSLNDSQGHTVGDQLLIGVAKRLQSCVREGDTVARLGGDEFVVMLEHLAASPAEAASLAENVAHKILAALDMPYWLDHFEHHSSASIGVTLFRDGSDAIDDLLKRADLAMYQAKSAGRNAIRFFDPAMQAAVEARSSLEAAVRSGLKNNEFLLYYQPQVDGAGKVIAVEALARWQHPERGLVPPLEFIALAEETGLIIPLGHQMLREACEQLQAWSKHPATMHLSVSVNVSPRQFHHKDFVDMVIRAVDVAHAQPNLLVLEITEGLLMDNLEENVAKMHSLRSKGIRFSIDDFGTGYSSLAYLKRLPLDELKIDRAFVADIEQDENAAAICSAFINLAHILGLRVVAEGVETEAQRHFLANVNTCDIMQGYLFSKPLSAAELVHFLG